jgi:putative transposase
MARPYSMDLCERAVARVQAGESVRFVAQVLNISPSSVVKWSQRVKATGSPAAGKMGGYRPRVLVGEHAVFLRRRVRQGRFHLALPCGGACRPRPQSGLPDGLGLRSS